MRKNHEKISKHLDQNRRASKGRPGNSASTLWIKMYSTHKIMRYVENLPTDSEVSTKDKNIIINEARKNFIINLITGLEVFLKDEINRKCEDKCFDQQAIEEILKNTDINLHQAYHLFKVKKAKIGELVISDLSLNSSVAYINSLIKKLTGRDLLDSLEKIEIDGEGFPKEYKQKGQVFLGKKALKSWRRTIDSLFLIRHGAVHEIDFSERSYNKINDKQITHMVWVSIAFFNALISFFNELETKK